MRLNLPILERLENCQNILIAGIGGGFDVFIGLPIYFTLRNLGKTVHLANYTFANFKRLPHVAESEVLIPDRLVAVSGLKESRWAVFCAEGGLAQWLKTQDNTTHSIWLLPNEGGVAITEAYQMLIERLSPDALILVDGGVDSLMRGDEEEPGTLLEDSLSLVGVRTLPVPVKILACLGMGTEIEEGLAVNLALENIAALTRAGGFWGSCALTADMEAFQFYEAACRSVWEQPKGPKSHISTRVIPAVHGEFGNYHMYPYDQDITVSISPFMGFYWFFNAEAVIARHLLLDTLAPTTSLTHASFHCAYARREMKLRPAKQSRELFPNLTELL